MAERSKGARGAKQTVADGSTGKVVDQAWSAEEPAGDVWTARPWLSPTARAAHGKAARTRVPRERHAAFEPAADRDPIAILAGQEEGRLPNLVPLRHERMAQSPFSYYRGAAAVMAFDLADTPRSDLVVHACGDAHISNFGLFASPELTLVFDVNDFDETLPGPWEWDIKRLAASVVIAGRANGFSAAANRAAAMHVVHSYRHWMHRYAGMGLVEVLHASVTAEDIRAAIEESGLLAGHVGAHRAELLEHVFTKARQRDSTRAFEELTTIVNGRHVIHDDPPVVMHVELEGGPGSLERLFTAYRASLPESRRAFLERFRFVDFALKVVGVGSVATRCFIVVLEGRDENDALILQAKEATASVLEPYFRRSRYANHGRRVVVGQEQMQASSDAYLGWTRAGGHDYYFRELWDMKGSVDTTALQAPGLSAYARLCAWALARAHARTGDSVAIAAYLGSSEALDGAIADFAETYADQNERDHAAYLAAIRAGQISTPPKT